MKIRAFPVIASFLIVFGTMELAIAQQGGKPRFGYKGEPEAKPPRAKVVSEAQPVKKPAATPARTAQTTKKPAASNPAKTAAVKPPVKKKPEAASKPVKAVASQDSSAAREREKQRAAAREREREQERKAAALAARKAEERAKAKAVAKKESTKPKSGAPASSEKKAVAAAKPKTPVEAEPEKGKTVAGLTENGAEANSAPAVPPAPVALPSAFAAVSRTGEKPFEPAEEGTTTQKSQPEEQTAYQLIIKRKPPEKRALPPLPSGFTQRLYARTIGAGMGVLQSLPSVPRIKGGSYPPPVKPRPDGSGFTPAPSLERRALANVSPVERPAPPRWEPRTTPAAGRETEPSGVAATAPRKETPSPVEERESENPPGAREDKIDIRSDRQAEYDQENNRVVFTGKVEMNTDTIRLQTGKLEVFMRQDGSTERMEATGSVTLTTWSGEEQPRQTAKAGGAVYLPETGEIILRDWPEVRDAGKALISTDASTKIHLQADGGVRLDGPNRTIFER